MVVTPWGISCPERNRGTLGALWLGGANAQAFCGKKPVAHVPPQMPPQILDFLASFYVLSAVNIALFHRARTGEGQVVDVPLVRVSYWTNQCHVTWVNRSKNMLRMIKSEFENDGHWGCPIVTFNCHQSQDGLWFHLLGLDMKRHLLPTLRALGLTSRAILSAVYTYISEVRGCQDQLLIVKIKPIFRTLNHMIAQRCATMSMKELQTRFAQHNVWWCPVRVPSQLLDYPQAWATQTLARMEGANGSEKTVLLPPLQMYS